MPVDPRQSAELQLGAPYSLRVVGALNLPKTSNGNLPNAYVKVRHGKSSMRTRVVERIDNPYWNHEVHLLSRDPNSVLSLRVMHRTFNPFLPDPCLGCVESNVQNLVSLCNTHQGNVTLKLRNPNNLLDNEERGSIEVYLVEKAPLLASGLVIAEARNAMESNGVTAADGIAPGDVSVLTNPAVALANVISKLAMLDQLVGNVSKVHPYVSAAWIVTSSLYKAVRGQLDRDQLIIGLLAVLEDLYSFVEVLRSFPDKINVLEKTITKTAIQTVECAIFIREYSGHGFGGRIWRQTFSNTNETIARLTKKLTDLKSSLDFGVTIQTTFVSIRTSRAVEVIRESQSLEKLKPAVMDASARVGCLPSTRQDILQFIIDWVISSSGDQNILWLFGVAGSGKSILSTTITNYFRELGRLGAFLFFDRDVTERSNPSTVIRTLAYQLGVFDDRFSHAISLATDTLSWQWPLPTQMEKLITEPLSTVDNVTEQGPVVLVLDALDECGSTKTRKSLLDLLATELVKLPPNFRIIITSRAECDIQGSFSSRPNILFRELDITSVSNTNDIVAYFRHWMSIIRTSNHLLPLAPDWPGENTIVSLAERSSGLFVWASTVVAFIEDGHDPEERLAVILGSEIRARGERVLDELYTTALRSIGKWNDEAFRTDFRAIMGVILAARDPVFCRAQSTG